MEIKTVLYIGVAAVVSILVSVFQYVYKTKINSNLRWLLGFLRGVTIFGILLLLINPTITRNSYLITKPNLVILADNSTSVAPFHKSLENFIDDVTNSEEIKKRFNLHLYSFGQDIKALDSLDFTDNNTNIQKALSTVQEVHAREETTVLLLTDGNQTIGKDYSFYKSKTKVYPVVFGDTTQYKDLALGPITVNKYAFLKNKFPLETYLTYQGKSSEVAPVAIYLNGELVYQEKIKFTEDIKYKSIKAEIEASSVGVKNITIEAKALKDEQNKINNKRTTSIEVIDEKTNIGIISEIMHPDIGTLKKAIESNEQRAVFIFQPTTTISALEKIDLFIFYQPNQNFKPLFEFAKQKNTNSLIIAGLHTDYIFLNSIQNAFEIENGYPNQEVFGILNNGFTKFDISAFEMADFPPLNSNAGPVVFNAQHQSALGTQIKGINVQQSLWSIYENKSRKHSLLLGENIWKWRMQTYRNTGDFKNFDSFIANVIRFLTSSKNKSRLNINYEPRYEGSADVIITATYFNEAFAFDPNAKIEIEVTDQKTQKVITRPMLLKSGYFETDLSSLSHGNYKFEVSVQNEGFSKKGSFLITEFDLESQFISSNYKKLNQLALQTGGSLFYPSERITIKKLFIENAAFAPTEKSIKNVVSLIDFWVLLGIISLALALEWFIRKYNGLI